MDFPPPTVVNAGLWIAESDYGDGPWELADLPYLSTYRGILRVFWPSQRRAHINYGYLSGPALVTRGETVEGGEALEFFFPDKDYHFTIPDAHADRLPGDPAGKRPWELEIWLGYSPPRMERCYDAFWRAAPLPCLLPWDGPYPRTSHPPRKGRARRRRSYPG